MSILYKYPQELVYKIFQNLNTNDVLEMTEDPAVGSFAFRRKYNKIWLLPAFGHECVRNKFVYMSIERILELDAYPRFHHDTLVFSKLLSLEMLHSQDNNLISRFKCLEHMGTSLDPDEFLRISRFPLKTAQVRKWISEYTFPPTLSQLYIDNAFVNAPLPSSVKNLNVKGTGGYELRTKLLPEELKLLHVRNFRSIFFDLPLPSTLKELSLRDVSFNGLADFTHLVNLLVLDLQGVDLNAIVLPTNLNQLALTLCCLSNLKFIIPLSKLKILELTHIKIANYSDYNIEYPDSLRKLDIRCSLSPLSEVFYIRLPPLLSEFRLTGNRTFLNARMLYPETLRRLELVGLEGFYYHAASTTLAGIRFPEELEELSFAYSKLEDLKRTNLEELRLLKTLNLWGTGLVMGCVNLPGVRIKYGYSMKS